MFIGHFAVALAAKRAAPRTSLGMLLLAAAFLDVLWPVFLLLGWEHMEVSPGDTVVTPFNLYDYPYSHSLVAALGWSAIFAGIYFTLRRRSRTALVLALCVFSHWVLDFVTHRADMPLLFTGPKVGLGLWNSLWGTIIIEFALFAFGAAVYFRSTRAKDASGRFGIWTMLTFLVMAWLVAIFGPPPPSDWKVVAWTGNSVWLLILWAFWADRHREVILTEI